MELDPQRAGRAGTAAAVAQQWFSQPLFEGMDLDEDNEPAPAGQAGTARAAGQGLLWPLRENWAWMQAQSCRCHWTAALVACVSCSTGLVCTKPSVHEQTSELNTAPMQVQPCLQQTSKLHPAAVTKKAARISAIK